MGLTMGRRLKYLGFIMGRHFNICAAIQMFGPQTFSKTETD